MCHVWPALPSAWTLFKPGSAPVALSLSQRSAYSLTAASCNSIASYISCFLIVFEVLVVSYNLDTCFFFYLKIKQYRINSNGQFAYLAKIMESSDVNHRFTSNYRLYVLARTVLESCLFNSLVVLKF